MKENDLEILSRILDEDVSEFEAHRILKEMHYNPELRATYQRYNLTAHAIRKQLPTRLNHNFTDEVMLKISEDETNGLKTNGLKTNVSLIALAGSNKIKATVGLAIAASVTVFSFLTIQNFLQPNSDSANAPVIAERVIEESDIQRVNEKELQNFISNPKANADFNSYMANHAEYASPRVSMPHVRIVGYDKIESND